MTQAQTQTVQLAQDLQTKREAHMVVLEALPMPKARFKKFPYESMDEAVKDGFKLLDGDKRTGKDFAFSLLVKGYNTTMWRKAAEKNRETRDAVAEGDIEIAVKKVRAKKAAAAAEPKGESA